MTLDLERLAKLLGMLGSDFDGEVIASGRAASGMVRSAGLTWPEVVGAPPPSAVVWLVSDNGNPHTYAGGHHVVVFRHKSGRGWKYGIASPKGGGMKFRPALYPDVEDAKRTAECDLRGMAG